MSIPDHVSEQDFYWLAGLLEGEGSFAPGPPSAPNSVRITLSMTDRDVVARVAGLWRVSYHEVRKARTLERGWKPAYAVSLRGRRAAELMHDLLPLMGERRQLQIRRALANYDPYLRYKLQPEQIVEIRKLLAEGWTHTEIALKYSVDRSTVSHIKAGVRKAYR
jgi:hypothetical protein